MINQSIKSRIFYNLQKTKTLTNSQTKIQEIWLQSFKIIALYQNEKQIAIINATIVTNKNSLGGIVPYPINISISQFNNRKMATEAVEEGNKENIMKISFVQN